jgi:hypothetical protein
MTMSDNDTDHADVRAHVMSLATGALRKHTDELAASSMSASIGGAVGEAVGGPIGGAVGSLAGAAVDKLLDEDRG